MLEIKLATPKAETSPPRRAMVWVEECSIVHTVPIGETTSCNFGPWLGKKMLVEDIVLYAEIDNGEQGSGLLGEGNAKYIDSRCTLTAPVLVKYEPPRTT